jgi:hypothetical protein
MPELSLFNIGFRSENTCEALEEYVSGRIPSRLALEDSLELIKECFSFQPDDMSSLFSSRNLDMCELVPLVFDLFNKKSLHEMKERITNVESTLRRILGSDRSTKQEDVEHALAFFRRLSQLCLRRTAASKMQSPILSTLAV